MSTQLDSTDQDTPVSGPVHIPTAECVAASQMTAFTVALRSRTGEPLLDYAALHAFSVREFRIFWRVFLDWVPGLKYEGNADTVCVGDTCERAVFFPNVQLSYADTLLGFDAAPDSAPALSACHADGSSTRLTRGELRVRVARLASALEGLGLRRGDRVAAAMRSDEYAIIVALAVTAIGATLSTASAEMGGDALLDRFGQLSPRMLFVHGALPSAGGGSVPAAGVASLAASLESVQHVVALDDEAAALKCAAPVHAVEQLISSGSAEAFEWRRFPFNHPLFIMFSSGTTGKPKCIVHGAGGALLEHLKEHRLHSDFRAGEKLYFHTSCAWMMWNWQLSALASGVELVTYDGPLSSVDTLWKIVADERVTVFGTSPAYLRMCSEARLEPGRQFDLGALRAMMSTGAVLFDAQFRWVVDHVKPLPIQSISGGTDILGCFVLCNPNLPVWVGQAQCRSLALDVQAWEAGRRTPGAGELVCVNPFPSRPLGFFGDRDGARFHEAYFSTNAGVWTHGDQIEFAKHGGARLHGRSDGVLNVRGINVGPGEIYRVLSDFPAIHESMVVEQRVREQGDAHAYDKRVVLFVVLEHGASLTSDISSRIRRELARRASPAHVPDLILAVDELPVTHSGKLSDAAVRDTVNGLPVRNTAALRNPACLEAIRRHPGLVPDAKRVAETVLAPTGDTAAELEAYLIALWERLFGFGPISRDDNFFDLGGDSLLGVALIGEIEQATRRRMRLATLLVAPTIAAVAAQLRGDTCAPCSETLVPMRGGSGSPVFWIHSLAGTVMECQRVVGAMHNERPFYGVHAKGLTGEEEPSCDVAEMATRYIREMRNVQPTGPYTVIGYSFGGLVAFEIAQQLHRSGERVSMLCLVDTHVHERCLPWRDWLRYQQKYAQRQWRQWRAVPASQRAHFVAAKLTGGIDKLRLQSGRMAHKPVPEIVHMPLPLQRMREGMRVAMTTYRLDAYHGGPVHYVRATVPVGDLCDPMPAWRRVAQGGIVVSHIGGGHLDMVLGGNIETLASILDRILAGEVVSDESDDVDYGTILRGALHA